MNNALHFSSATVEHSTAQETFDKLNSLYGPFTLDPCATAENAKCKKFYTRLDDGLAQSWANEIVFMNPPYGEPENPCKLVPGASMFSSPVYNAKGHEVYRYAGTCNKKKCGKRGYHVSEYIPGCIDWMRKASLSASLEGATVVCLIPSRTDVGWMHTFVLDKGKVNPKKAEVEFIKGRLTFGDANAPAPFPNTVVVFRPKGSKRVLA